MNCLFVHDPEQGHSHHIQEMVEVFNNRFKTNMLVIDVNDENDKLPTGVVDVVILWCAVRWWKRVKTQIGGRPWVCAISWCFDDLIDMTTPGMGQVDAGIHNVICNCKQYVTQASAAFSASFALAPVFDIPNQKPPRYLFGTVLPNIKDRDFSQLLLTQRFIEKHYGKDEVNKKMLVVVKPGETMRLPEELDAAICPLSDDSYGMMRYFIPVPRITDYRGGVMPPELLQAVHCGAIPLMIRHPAIPDKLKGMRLFSSVKQYEDMIAGASGTNIAPERSSVPVGCKPLQLANKVKDDYAEWTWHAAKNV